jgi:hypothetical protein
MDFWFRLRCVLDSSIQIFETGTTGTSAAEQPTGHLCLISLNPPCRPTPCRCSSTSRAGRRSLRLCPPTSSPHGPSACPARRKSCRHKPARPPTPSARSSDRLQAPRAAAQKPTLGRAPAPPHDCRRLRSTEPQPGPRPRAPARAISRRPCSSTQRTSARHSRPSIHARTRRRLIRAYTAARRPATTKPANQPWPAPSISICFHCAATIIQSSASASISYSFRPARAQTHPGQYYRR